MVVEHGAQPVVHERADQVREVAMAQGLLDPHPLDLPHANPDRHREAHARVVRRPVRDRLDQGDAEEPEVAVGPQRSKGAVGGDGDKAIGARLLVLGLHAHVVHLARHGRVGQHHELLPAALRGLPCRRDRHLRKVRQAGVARHVQVDVRFLDARAGKVLREEGDEGDVGPVGERAAEARLARGVGEDVEAPLVGGAVGRAHQRRVGAHPLPEQRVAVGQDTRRRARVRDRRGAVRQRDVLDGPHDPELLRRRRANHQRGILHDMAGVHRRGVHVHAPGMDRDHELGRDRRRHDDALDVVDEVGDGGRLVGLDDGISKRVASRVRVDGVGGRQDPRVAAPGHKDVAEVKLALGSIGHDEVKVVDELDGGRRVPGRVRPCQRDPHRRVRRLGVRQLHLVRPRLSRDQALGVRPPHDGEADDLVVRAPCRRRGPREPVEGLARRREAAANGALHRRTTPARVVDRGVRLGLVRRVVHLRRVDQDRLVPRHRDAVFPPDLVVLLDLRKEARHRRARHRRARLIPVVRLRLRQQLLRHRPKVVGRVHLVFQPPLRRTRGQDVGARRDHVRLEPPKLPFRSNSHVAPARERRHLGVRVGLRLEDRVGLVRGILRVVAPVRQDREAGAHHHAVGVIDHGVGQHPTRLQRAHRQDVLRVARRPERIGAPAQPVGAARALVARREHVEDGLVARHVRQGVAHGGVIKRRDRVVLGRGRITPAVVRDGRVRAARRPVQRKVGARKRLLQVDVRGHRPHVEVDGQDEQPRRGCPAPELRVRGGPLRDANRARRRPASADRARHVRPVPDGILKVGGLRREHPPRKVRVARVDARVVDVHQHIRPHQTLHALAVREVG